ncbi:regulatory protein, luxR family [Asanoa hainanensis]|uniref:Regulatory protein, luxR family n=1 Tax=Asanoa hainanensis TaxID=560556 RepID=A0A239I1C8_9ACTN|nr:helix-turn-helix transcriptional regulator [Asanoa hainanensis]SNS87377.1 regulatory protein, luxR family [Asanoa hainanensis]
MRTVLVCVRTSQAAQNVNAAAARLGVAGAVRTAVSEPEVLLRLAERPADVVLADTAVTRPDTVGFTQRVLGRAPGATIVLFGSEDPRIAAAAVNAGARALIQGGDQDLVSVVAKAVLLLCVAGRVPAGAAVGGLAGAATRNAGPMRMQAGVGAGHPQIGLAESTAVVPVQRGDLGPGMDVRDNAEEGRYFGGQPDPVNRYGAREEPVTRRAALTERELQVLRGMADGKSNAEIGRELFVSEDTVKTHARRLFRKLGARDRAHAVAAGFRSGLVA